MTAKHLPLLERDRELHLVDRLARAAGRGQGAVLLVEAPAGMGKTGLLAAAADRARARSMRVVTARGGELERDFAYGVVRGLFEAPLREPDADGLLDGPARRAAELLGLGPATEREQRDGPARPAAELLGFGPAAGEDPTATVLHGLYWLAVNAAAGRPLALVVDDLHWADPASLRYLAYLAARLPAAPILVIAAARPGYPPEVADLVAALKRTPAAQVADLAPLSAGATAALVRRDFDAGAGEPFCAACHAVTGGNPFLLGELLAALRDQGVSADEAAALREPGVSADATAVRRVPGVAADEAALRRASGVSADDAAVRRAPGVSADDAAVRQMPGALFAALRDPGVAADDAAVRRVAGLVPGALAETIVLRLGRLPDAAAALAKAVAVLGTDVAVRPARAVAGLDVAAAAAARDALTAAGILHEQPGPALDFVHPLVRAAVHESIPAAERALLHRAAARQLAADGVDALRVAPHVLATDPDGDPWAVGVLREAATAAVRRGAPDLAVRLLRRALDEPPAPDLRGAVLAELGKAELRTAQPDAAVAHLRAAFASTGDPRARVDMAHDLAIGLVAPGRYREAVEMLADTVSAARAVDPELALRLEAELLCAARLDAATLPIARRRYDELPDDLPGRTTGERMLQATLAHWRAMRGAGLSTVHKLIAEAVDGGLLAERPAESGVVIDALVTLTVIDDADRAERAFAQAFADVRARSSVIGFARLSCMRSMLWYRRGALADAESDARSAIELATAPGYRVAGMAHGPLLDALVPQGKLDEADAALVEAGLDGELPDSYMLNYTLCGRARLRLAQDRRAEAIADLEELDRREAKWRAPNPGALGYPFDLALAYQQNGETDRAAAVAERALVAARTGGVDATIGAALRTAGLVTGDLARLEESVATLEGTGARLQLARSLVELGAAIRRSGQRTAAREPLGRGMELAYRCGAVTLVEQAREELLATGSRPRGPTRTGLDALTPSERRVARMAADGLTNREIAQALFVTVRTVQVHLQHCYAKLGIASRARLRDALDARLP